MDIDRLYEEVLKELAQGGRGLKKYSPDDIQTLANLLANPADKTEALLCLITHSAYPDRKFEAPLLKLLTQKELKPTLLVYALNAARKHIILARFKEGQRLDLDFLESLRFLLQHSHLDVVEWTLRTIEESGSQGVLLLPDIRKIRPSVFSLWQAQRRTILELVTLLERRWERPSDAQKR